MSYDGNVEPGGPAQARDLGPVTIRKLAVSAMHNNVYLLTDNGSGRQLMIDAADDAAELLGLVAENGNGTLDAVVTTHQHWDHVRALPAVLEATGATSIAGTDDADALPVEVDVRVGSGDTVRFGGIELEIITVRGHTPGGICIVYRAPDGTAHLFTGDSLFPGGVGATDRYDYQSFPQLIADVEERLFARFPDDTWVYPGHGDDTVIGRERPQLPQWRERGW